MIPEAQQITLSSVQGPVSALNNTYTLRLKSEGKQYPKAYLQEIN